MRHSEVQADSGKRHTAGTDFAAQIAAEKDEALTACALPHMSGPMILEVARRACSFAHNPSSPMVRSCSTGPTPEEMVLTTDLEGVRGGEKAAMNGAHASKSV